MLFLVCMINLIIQLIWFIKKKISDGPIIMTRRLSLIYQTHRSSRRKHRSRDKNALLGVGERSMKNFTVYLIAKTQTRKLNFLTTQCRKLTNYSIFLNRCLAYADSENTQTNSADQRSFGPDQLCLYVNQRCSYWNFQFWTVLFQRDSTLNQRYWALICSEPTLTIRHVD